MPRKKRPSDVHALAFLNRARSYLDAANELFAVSYKRPRVGNSRALSDPINFLYFHAVELALKAFISSRGGEIRFTHSLTELYEECQTFGLALTRQNIAIENVVGLLESGNVEHGFRYFTLTSTTEPDLGWTRDVVSQFMEIIAPEITAKFPGEDVPGNAIKVTLVFGPSRVQSSSKNDQAGPTY